MGKCRPFEEAELARIASLAERGFWMRRNVTLLLLGCATGFRISELLSLCRRDVLDLSGRVQPVLTVLRSKMKGKQESRQVDLNADVRSILAAWLAAQEARGYILGIDPLFPKRGALAVRPGDHLAGMEPLSRTTAWGIVRHLVRLAGLSESHVGTHSFRKTFTKNTYAYWLECVARGERVDPLMQLKQALGHKQVTSTTAYLQNVSKQDLDRSFGAASAAVSRAWSAARKNTRQNPKSSENVTKDVP